MAGRRLRGATRDPMERDDSNLQEAIGVAVSGEYWTQVFGRA